ncbi:RluA family pseudouridine synthase [Streptococcus iniae]|uniref:Pseudouridine synthase n=1 Tax=Streptococcus iniae TaxID=1346 RepID=A0A1J0MZ14_STRIN|nr:RluA family pseudouridine synthase [Streptococcus iniae]AGM98868.1 pseudouridine synthase, RluA family [Streptococcus iniae SF1]AHY15826.1 pseudouridine synthase [Streptococcus iniae]AHY17694.1 pseudouridine synthase [Streptococcus iniae]APD31863.1 RNA pseudouridine synthase [Streptococcus iniae]ASL34807.1 RNA pseudouridylate synthase [Streptococcus iniae]
MRFDYVADKRTKVKTLLKSHDVSKGLLAKVKYRGGQILVNGVAQNAIYLLNVGDLVSIDIPNEQPFEKLEAVSHPLDIVYEDDHFMVINKPFGFASIPSAIHSNTIANFVKAYYIEKDYPNKQVHIVTRLDRDTSGLMLFAKHGYAHARLDKQLQKRSIEKRYYALVSGQGQLPDHGEIIEPIGRSKDSIITRAVDPMGKYARTSYQVIARYPQNVHLVDIKLHTGRTHQIRVHFSHIGFPLLGDDLYGGRLDLGITRQALHCHFLGFYNPFEKNDTKHTINLTDDFDNVIIGLQKK